MISVRTRVTLLTSAALAVLCAAPAFAQSVVPAGTGAGTTISNQATVSYTIGGAAATPVTSNTATFLVDKKVNLTVTAINSPTYVSVGSTDQVTTFTVTNNTNATQDFLLAANNTSIALGGLLGTGDFLPTTVRAFADTNGNNVWDAGDLAYIDELPADQSIRVFVVANIPTGTIHTGNVYLQATVAAGRTPNSPGTALAATSVLAADTPGVVDVVFADTATPLALTIDDIRDGKKLAFSQFQIDNATVTLSKTSTIVYDPVNLAAFPKAIPGATVRYCITATNNGPGIATGVKIDDAIPTNTTYVPNSITWGLPATICTLGLVAVGTAGTQDGTGVHATLGTLAVGVPLAASFLVTIN